MPRPGGPASDAPPIRAHLFGAVRLAVGDRNLPDDSWPRRSARTLLLLLLAVPGHRLPRDQVMDALWPEAPPESAANGLYTALHVLRRALQPELHTGRESTYVDVRGGLVGLWLSPGSYIDVDAFREAVSRAGAAPGSERGAILREAVAIYQGDLLAEEAYAEWPVPMRERLRRDWRRAVLELAEVEREAGRPLTAVPSLEAVLENDPTDEVAYQALMRAHAAAGQTKEALLQYDRFVRVLKAELEAEPSAETTALAEAIEQTPAPPPVLKQPRLELATLPAPATPLIGRATDVAAIRSLLVGRRERLVTILGPGGIGKTRLAIAVGRDVADAFADAVGFVDLASIRDPALVIPSIARAVGIRDRADRGAAEQLLDALYQREVLLVLDNFEQVIDAAPDIAVLIEHNSGLQILATSRAPLELRAERRFVVGPLALPSIGTGAGRGRDSAAAVAESAAAALFADRVRAAVPDFTVTDANAEAVADICVRLEGVPLAIELAAVRARQMTPAELAQRLETRLPLLTGGPRDMPSRLQTMHNAIAWSYDLLDEAERRLLRRLSVFVGGSALDAVETVVQRIEGIERTQLISPQTAAGASDGDARAGETRGTREVAAALADKSLLGFAPTDGTRIRMLETIREFGLERLAESGELALVRSVHAELYLELAESAAPELTGPEQGQWLERLEADHDNLRSAYEFLLADEGPHRVFALCRALSRFWRMHGHYSEGKSRVERALARPGPLDLSRARLMLTAGDLGELQADYEHSETLYREALATFSDHGDGQGMAEASLGLGAIAIGRSELPVATEWINRALELFRVAEDRRGTASALNYLATIAFHRGELQSAAHDWDECLGLLAELGDDRARAIGLSNLGVLELERGRPERAIAHHRAALEICRTLDDKWGATHSLINLGRALVTVGQPADARPLLEEAVANCRDLGDPLREAVALQNLAIAALESGDDHATAQSSVALSLQIAWRTQARLTAVDGLEIAARTLIGRDPATAARQLGAAETLREQIAAVRESADQPAYDATVAALRSTLEPAEFQAAWAAGASDSLDVAMSDALAALRDR